MRSGIIPGLTRPLLQKLTACTVRLICSNVVLETSLRILCCRVFSAVIFCAVGIGNTVAFVPDFTKAKVAAAKLFKLFDRVPPIDVASPGGIQLVRYNTCVCASVKLQI